MDTSGVPTTVVSMPETALLLRLTAQLGGCEPARHGGPGQSVDERICVHRAVRGSRWARGCRADDVSSGCPGPTTNKWRPRLEDERGECLRPWSDAGTTRGPGDCRSTRRATGIRVTRLRRSGVGRRVRFRRPAPACPRGTRRLRRFGRRDHRALGFPDQRARADPGRGARSALPEPRERGRLRTQAVEPDDATPIRARMRARFRRVRPLRPGRTGQPSTSRSRSG